MTHPREPYYQRHCHFLPHENWANPTTIVSGMRHNFYEQLHLLVVRRAAFPFWNRNPR
jgi:hypothetical protein